MKYPHSENERSEEFKYAFTIYSKKEKEFIYFYNLEGARKMKKILTEKKEVFESLICDEDGSLTEVNL